MINQINAKLLNDFTENYWKNVRGRKCPKCDAPVEFAENTYNGEVYARMAHCSRTPDCGWADAPDHE